MFEFANIEEDYLATDVLDYENLENLYQSHRFYFDHVYPADDATRSKLISILSEMATVYYRRKNWLLSRKLFLRITTLFRQDMEDEPSKEDYTITLFYLGLIHFHLSRYKASHSYFKLFAREGGKNRHTEILSEVSQYLQNRRYIEWCGITGFCFIASSYLVEWFFPYWFSFQIMHMAWLGILCVWAYFIASAMLKKPEIAES